MIAICFANYYLVVARIRLQGQIITRIHKSEVVVKYAFGGIYAMLWNERTEI